jgi:hypothetical protein
MRARFAVLAAAVMSLALPVAAQKADVHAVHAQGFFRHQDDPRRTN